MCMGGCRKMGWRGRNMACTGPHSSGPACAYSTTTSGFFWLWGGLMWKCEGGKLVVQLPVWDTAPCLACPFLCPLSTTDYVISCCDLLVALVSGPWKPLLQGYLEAKITSGYAAQIWVYMWTEPRLHGSLTLLAKSVVGRVSLCLTNARLTSHNSGMTERDKVLLCICTESLLFHLDSSSSL